MLTRVYIDNYLCFVNFEYRPERTQLIFGSNGAGKSSFMDALLALRQFAITGLKVDQIFRHNLRTRWLDRPTQTFELQAELDGRKYQYRLVLDLDSDQSKVRVESEEVNCDEKPIFEFRKGEVRLYNDRFEFLLDYPFDSSRSAFETISDRKDNLLLSRFKTWFGSLYCFRINPYGMDIRAEGEHLYPNVNLSNFAAWYRHLLQSDQRGNAAMLASVRSSLESFSSLHLETAGENIRLLVADFDSAEGTNIKFGFTELSEGQRCLICLYTILHFLIAKGSTIILDEPDNFVSLREIQPWLMAVSDAVDDGHGQVLIISHHPEIINQWGPGNGVQFVRDGIGPVIAKPFVGSPDSALFLSELIARGWENG